MYLYNIYNHKMQRDGYLKYSKEVVKKLSLISEITPVKGEF